MSVPIPSWLRLRATALLAGLVLTIAVMPHVEASAYSEPILLGLSLFIFLGGLLGLGNDRRWLLPAVGFALLAAVLSVFEERGNELGTVEANGARMLFFALVTANLLVYVLRRGRVDADKLSAGVAAYMMIGLTWTSAYRIVELRHPGSLLVSSGDDLQFSGVLYYSYVTLTTLGYGDITPASSYARSLAILEAIVGVMFLTVFVARLVSMFGQDVKVET